MLGLRGFFKDTQSSVNEPSQTAPVKQPIAINTALVSPPHLLMSPHGTVTSPISIYQNARCNGICAMTEEEENQGRVVSQYTVAVYAFLSFHLGLPISMQG
jgi:hypothetical protein